MTTEAPWSPSAARERCLARAHQLELAGDVEKATALRRIGMEDLESPERFARAWREAAGEKMP